MIYVITDDLNVEINHDNKRGVSHQNWHSSLYLIMEK